jgi:two-component system sensor histidine kinase DesK
MAAMSADRGRIVLLSHLWLVYLGFVYIGPLTMGGGLMRYTEATLVVGLAGWFFHEALIRFDDCRQARLWNLAAAALGFACAPWNPAAITCVTMAAAFAAFMMSKRHAVVYVLALTAGAVLEAFLLRHWYYPWNFAAPIITIPIVGIANLLAADYRKRGLALLRAQQDVEEVAKLAERERIARDLHDLLGHTLSVIAMKSELASRLAEIDPARATTEIRDVERVSREALSEVRAAVEGYRGRGWQGELERATGALRSAGVQVETDIQRPVLTTRQEAALSLALREAATNIIRHARATTCCIALDARDGIVRLTVSDDGVGTTAPHGSGLSGMRERVSAAGGELRVASERGTTIAVSFPMQTEATA